MPRAPLARRLAVATLVVASLAACVEVGPKPGPNHIFGDPRNPDYPYWHEDFPDASAFWDSLTGRYYAYSTPTGARNLPILYSDDLVNWQTRPSYNPPERPPHDVFFNDGMTKWAQWAWELPNAPEPWDDWFRKVIWAPHGTRFGNTYIVYYATAISDADGNPATYQDERFCLSYAASTSPLGPFRDNTSGPLVCGDKSPWPLDQEPSNNPNGSIDPSVAFDDNGDAYLLWKNSGAPIALSNTRIYARKLAATRDRWAPGFAPGSFPVQLAVTKNDSWMGYPGGIEAPSMVKYQGVWYLFFSANHTETLSYATGYSVCSGPLGPCRMWPSDENPQPLLSTANTGQGGPGGATAFVDREGRLRLLYHSWANNNAGYEWGSDGGYGQRRMSIVELVPTMFGLGRV